MKRGWASIGDHGWIVVLVHVAWLTLPPLTTSVGLGEQMPSGSPWLAVPLGVAVIGLAVRHGLAVAAGAVPRYVRTTVASLVVLVYAPVLIFGWGWFFEQVAVMAAVPLVLRGRRAAAALALPLLGSTTAVVVPFLDKPVTVLLYDVVYIDFTLVVGAAALYGSARLVRVLRDLRHTQGELAELALHEERLRASRDLHDLLGQSLSAISLKGDLAVKLLARDVPAARAEVESLTDVARQALHGVHRVTRDEHALDLRTEIDGAAALAAAAHIALDVDLDLAVADLDPETERVLAWAVREGLTNVVRHSTAGACTIAIARDGHRVVLTVTNDGASGALDSRGGERRGCGLEGLAQRARTIGGSVEHGSPEEGVYRLVVSVPWRTA